MTEDLRRALDDLAARTAAEHRSHGGLPVGDLTARAGRVRARRTAWTSGVIAAALVVVTGTGFAMTRGDRGAEPLPAGTPTVTPSPSPTASTSASLLPTGDASRPFGECGSLVGAATAPATDPTASISLTASGSVLGGQAVEVRTMLVPPTGATRGFERDSGPRVVIAHAGVVVATIDAYPRSEEPHLFLRASSVEFVNTLATTVTHAVPVVCDGAGSGVPGAALPAGDYQVLAVEEIWWADTDPETVAWPDATTVAALAEATGAVHTTVVGGPVALSISGEQIDPASVPAEPTGTPTAPPDDGTFRNVCAPPEPGTTLAGFTTGGSADPVRISPDETIPFGMTVAYAGPGRARWGAQSPSLAILRDGAVVAVAEGIDDRIVDGDHGTAQTLASEGSGAMACEDGWTTGPTTLAPGTYQAVPWTTIWVDRLTAADGSAVSVPSGDGYVGHPVAGTPFTLVVE